MCYRKQINTSFGNIIIKFSKPNEFIDDIDSYVYLIYPQKFTFLNCIKSNNIIEYFKLIFMKSTLYFMTKIFRRKYTKTLIDDNIQIFAAI